MDSVTTDLASVHCWHGITYRKKKRIEFGNRLVLLVYVKASDKFKRQELFEILRNKNIGSGKKT